MEVEVVPRRGKKLWFISSSGRGWGEVKSTSQKKTNTLLRLNLFPRLHGADRRGQEALFEKNKHHLSKGSWSSWVMF
ncbi:hypothetical protein HanIR_Chr13g0653511 [Helianthus annuus]|nr:hypothetical protein HanIR_Chr13g0653511 [Helianthus annuus]